jgi:hypothetical protein
VERIRHVLQLLERRSPNDGFLGVAKQRGVDLRLALPSRKLAHPIAQRLLRGPDAWLLRVPTADEAILARLADEGGRPVRLGPGYSLVLATPDEERLPALQSLRPERLGVWRSDRAYYLVYLRGNSSGAEPVDLFGRVLHRDLNSAVVEVSPGGEDALTIAYRCELIPPRTLRLGAGLARAAGSKARRTNCIVARSSALNIQSK